jgi:lysophospholipase L1-like esterase
MKRLILILSIMLGACSQAVQEVQTESPQTLLDAPVATEPVVVDMTTETEVPQTINALPSGPVTLVALGDSLTAGDGDDSERGGYPGRLLEMVNTVRPGSVLVNLGQSGWSSDALINGDQGISSQLTRAVTEVKSAISQGNNPVALVWIGSNDLWYLYEYGEGSDENNQIDADRYSTNLDMILSQLTDAGARVIIAMLDDQTKRPVAIKGEAFVSITPDEMKHMSSHVNWYNEIIAQKAMQYGALTVSFFGTDVFTNPDTLYYDGNHPNSAGYDIIAQMWFDVLGRMLQ